MRMNSRMKHAVNPCDLWNMSNIGMPITYFTVGVLQTLSMTPTNIYLVKEIDAEPRIQNTVRILCSIPWSLKVFVGFLSDSFPLFGYQRKSYLLLGCFIYVISFLYYVAIGEESAQTLAIIMLFSSLGLVFMDVMSDTMCVQRSTFENISDSGKMQTACYLCRFAGNVIGAVIGLILSTMSSLSYSNICIINCILPTLILPFILALSGNETQPSLSLSLKRQLYEIWQTVRLNAVWKTMSFIFLYNALQVPNAAWQSYLQLTLKFPAWVLGGMVILGSLMTFVGILAFRYYYFDATWRKIYFWTTILLSIFSGLQLVLISGLNESLGISSYIFAMGDDVFTSYISGIQLLPICIMFMSICPTGAAGTSYALLTSFSNISLAIGSSIGTYFSSLWDVSNTTMANNHLDGLWYLSITTSLLSIVPLAFLYLLPGSAVEQYALRKDTTRSNIGGLLFLVGFTLSLMWVLVCNVYEIW
eukprot:GSChrysophyteH2.ASY1.ANO1.1193.1 assembled CDS